MTVRAILNPRAGLSARRARAAVEQGRAFWPSLEVVETAHPGHAVELAREAAAAGYDLVLAVGGDGTANEVAWGLLGSSATLGLVPVGSGNGLARALRIPLDPRRAVPLLGAGLRRRMDVGAVNGRPFLNVAGAGFDAAVGHVFHDHGKGGGRRGVLSYVRIALQMAFGYRAQSYRVSADGAGFEGRALIVAFVNGRQYGGGAILAPRSRLDDGVLDVVVVEDGSRLAMLANAPRLFLGTIDRYRRYRRFAARQLRVESDGPLLHHCDGEPEPAAPALEVRLEPRALEILVPRATAEDPEGPFTQ